VLGNSHSLDELIQLQLSFCLPLLQGTLYFFMILATVSVTFSTNVQCTLCYETMGYSQECLGTPQRSRGQRTDNRMCVRFHVPAVRRPTLVRQEGNFRSGYKNTDLKWSRKRIELSPEVIVQVHRLNRPVWARGRCRISPPRFLAECCKRQLNQVKFSFAVF